AVFQLLHHGLSGPCPSWPMDEARWVACSVFPQSDELARGTHIPGDGISTRLVSCGARKFEGGQAVAAWKYRQCGGRGGHSFVALEKAKRLGEKHVEILERHQSPTRRNELDGYSHGCRWGEPVDEWSGLGFEKLAGPTQP